MKPFLRLLILLLLVALTACQSPTDATAPSAAIVSPASGSPVSGTVNVQADATDNQGISSVKLYVRGEGSSGRGVLVNAAVSAPYVVSWDTSRQPNAAALELLAVAIDTAGNEGESAPVTVRTQNSGVPSLSRLFAYTLPLDSAAGLSGASFESGVPDIFAAAKDAMPPSGFVAEQPGTQSPPRPSRQEAAFLPQADERSYALEWNWEQFVGIEGYGIYLSSQNLAGDYQRVHAQSASAGSGGQKYSQFQADAQVGDTYWGLISGVVSAASGTETGFSNADAATMLPAQTAVSPARGSTIGSGRPSFTWTPNSQADGYLFYVYDQDPLANPSTTAILCSNFPNATAATAASYPESCQTLITGTYYWWAVGVAFDASGVNALSFSEPHAFTVP